MICVYVHAHLVRVILWIRKLKAIIILLALYKTFIDDLFYKQHFNVGNRKHIWQVYCACCLETGSNCGLCEDCEVSSFKLMAVGRFRVGIRLFIYFKIKNTHSKNQIKYIIPRRVQLSFMNTYWIFIIITLSVVRFALFFLMLNTDESTNGHSLNSKNKIVCSFWKRYFQQLNVT